MPVDNIDYPPAAFHISTAGNICGIHVPVYLALVPSLRAESLPVCLGKDKKKKKNLNKNVNFLVKFQRL